MADRAAGFTLIEVVIALLVLMTAVAGVASLADAATRARGLARQRTALALIGLCEVESIRAGLLPAGGVEYFDARARSLGPVRVPAAVFVAKWQSSPSAIDAGTSLVRIRMAPVGSEGPLAPIPSRSAIWLVATSGAGTR